MSGVRPQTLLQVLYQEQQEEQLEEAHPTSYSVGIRLEVLDV